jgi:hypothetical protein
MNKFVFHGLCKYGRETIIFLCLLVSASSPRTMEINWWVKDSIEHSLAAIKGSKIDLFGARVLTVADEKNRPIAYYRSFPKNVQRLLQLSDIEAGRCKNGHGNERATLRACNRSDLLGAKIGQMGWCHRNLEHDFSANHWMGCGPKGEVEPQQAYYEHWFFNEADFKERPVNTPIEKLPCDTAQPKLPPAGSAAAQRFDIFGMAHYSAVDHKENPDKNYLTYPATVGRMMQHHDMEVEKCYGYGDMVASLRACNRRNRLLAQIEDRGWCWGSIDHVSPKGHWAQCSNIAGYTPDQPRADSVLYGLEDMRKATAEVQATCL